MPVLRLEDIIRSKEAANRPKDQRTLPLLRQILAAVRACGAWARRNRCRYAPSPAMLRRRLEHHHRHPFGLGGDHGPQHPFVVHGHNQYLAEHDYDKAAMARPDAHGTVAQAASLNRRAVLAPSKFSILVRSEPSRASLVDDGLASRKRSARRPWRSSRPSFVPGASAMGCLRDLRAGVSRETGLGPPGCFGASGPRFRAAREAKLVPDAVGSPAPARGRPRQSGAWPARYKVQFRQRRPGARVPCGNGRGRPPTGYPEPS